MSHILEIEEINQEQRCLIIAGYPGAGKSFIGEIMAQQLGAILLDKDTFIPKMSDDIEQKRTYINKEESDNAYNMMLNLASQNLNIGSSVIMVAPFTHQFSHDSEWIKNNLLDTIPNNVIVDVIWIDADADIEKDRLENRDLNRDINTLSDWEHYVSYHRTYFPDNLDPMTTYIFDNHIDSNPWEIKKKITLLIRELNHRDEDEDGAFYTKRVNSISSDAIKTSFESNDIMFAILELEDIKFSVHIMREHYEALQKVDYLSHKLKEAYEDLNNR